MRHLPALGAAAFALTAASAVLAQPTSPASPETGAPAATPPAASEPAPSATTPSGAASATTAAPTAPSAGANATNTAAIVPGLPVKDKTGAAIGTVTSVKPDASGKQVATIKMGADSFSVDTSALAVENGSAMVNATQAQIRQMMQSAGHK